MKNIFNQIQMAMPKSNVFDLTHDVKLTLQMGKLTPICVMEAVPGDKFNISSESLIRFAPLVSPMMHRVDVTVHYFFVPNRILWPNWEKWIVGPDPGDISPAFPTIQINDDDDVKSLANYLGIPVSPTSVYHVSALPFMAYQKIYNEYYRDQNLINPVLVGGGGVLVDGDNTPYAADLKAFRRRAWEHDYFTSALPFAQKGDPVSVPLGFEDVEVRTQPSDYTTPAFVESAWNYPPVGVSNKYVRAEPPGTNSITNNLLYAKTSDLQSTTTVTDLRRSFKLQEWLEKNARGGTRYIENILAHFGVKSSDKRLQRPEYITGTKSPVTISEVLNTTGETLPQGNMAGHAVSVTGGKYGNYFCEEHGYVVGIMSVMPKTAYQQGVPRHFLKTDRLEYFWPSFAHIGEQEIKNMEVYMPHTDPADTFGYIPRYAEYKYAPSRVAGDFQDTLDFWHLGRIFAAQPSLNQSFIECDPSRRVFAVTDPDEDPIYAHVLNKIKAVRKMPYFGNPQF